MKKSASVGSNQYELGTKTNLDVSVHDTLGMAEVEGLIQKTTA